MPSFSTGESQNRRPDPNYSIRFNQPAFEKLFELYSAICDFDEREITIKHEGRTLAYNAELNGKNHLPNAPDWTKGEELEAVPNNSAHTTKKEEHGTQ